MTRPGLTDNRFNNRFNAPNNRCMSGTREPIIRCIEPIIRDDNRFTIQTRARTHVLSEPIEPITYRSSFVRKRARNGHGKFNRELAGFVPERFGPESGPFPYNRTGKLIGAIGSHSVFRR